VKLDAHILFLVMMLAASLMATLLPLLADFGEPTPVQTTVFVLLGVLSAFMFGKRFGERAH
jgi:hypothetical protein